MELVEGLEPPTSRLQNESTTVVLYQHKYVLNPLYNIISQKLLFVKYFSEYLINYFMARCSGVEPD